MNEDKAGRTYYIKDFLVVGTLDPKPFADNATVEFRYWQANQTTRSLTLSRNTGTKRWQGYKRRPARHVFFAGVGLYLPKIEQRDFITRKASQLSIMGADVVSEEIKKASCAVLGHTYDRIVSNRVSYSSLEGTIISVERHGTAYSEAHMGYGEGRSQYLVAALEVLPEKSLVLIEEPETSLHASAQYEFGRYLVDVTSRRRHQVFLTTHSEFLLEALPSESRLYLNRRGTVIDVLVGLTAGRAKSLMAQGHVKALHVLVEDDCAKAITTEILRRADPTLLDTIGIHAAGAAEVIGTTVKTLAATGLAVAAVRDGDKNESPKDNIFKLPGAQAPERELLACGAVKQHVSKTYAVQLDDFLAGLGGLDHHEWLRRLASRLALSEAALVSELARVYASALTELDVDKLAKLIKEATRK